MRARSVASRKLLGCSSPVETQLFIQTRAISSYSSLRAGRMVGGAIQSVPDSNVAVSGAKRESLRDNIARAPLTSPMAVGSLRSLPPLPHFLISQVEAVQVHHLGPCR